MNIDGVIVVEGKSDVAFLSSFITAEFITTNGSEISKDTINYIKKVSETKKVYVLTDPDYPDGEICVRYYGVMLGYYNDEAATRKVLDENIPNLNHCFIKKECSIKNGKVGVAESTKEEIENALKNAVTTKVEYKENISMNDLVNLGLSGQPDSESKRNKIAKQLSIGHCNAKTFLKRLNYCDINIDDLKKML